MTKPIREEWSFKLNTNYNSAYEQLTAEKIAVLKNEPLKNHTTFKIGGPCPLFVTVNSVQELKTTLKILDTHKIKFFLLGNGSNLLVDDSGINSAVITLSGEFKKIEINGNTIACGAGVSLAKLCTAAAQANLQGLEFAYGIPGSTGGAAFMNAGAYGGEMADVLTLAEHITQDGEDGITKGEQLQFGYRSSCYRQNGCIITKLHFALQPGKFEEINAKMKDVMQRRTDKQPLELPSAGSVFKRPQGAFAGTLIEQCGLKGYKIGGAEVSAKHAGFIVNSGGATCDDVLNLIKHIQTTVQEKTGYFLETEVIYLK
jgi:UDP-N-acetylmuramate dehydrogenase